MTEVPTVRQTNVHYMYFTYVRVTEIGLVIIYFAAETQIQYLHQYFPM